MVSSSDHLKAFLALTPLIVYFDEAAEAAADPNAEVHDERGDGRKLPLVGSILALFSAFATWLNIGSG